MRYFCPKDVKKMLLQRARTVHWKKWTAKHGYEELKEGVWLEPALALLRKKTKRAWTEKASKSGIESASRQNLRSSAQSTGRRPFYAFSRG